MSAAIDGVKVVVRVRPRSEREKLDGRPMVVTSASEKKEISVIKEVYGRATTRKHHYNFDEVFTNFTTQEELFNETLEPMINDVMSGFEATVFAYGQTGTGKTYTMEGDTTSEKEQGVIPRSIRAIFDRLAAHDYVESSVKVTYLEIYNEELGDLLLDAKGEQLMSPSKDRKGKLGLGHGERSSTGDHTHHSGGAKGPKLTIVEDAKKAKGGVGRGVYCHGLNEVDVHSVADVLNILQQAQERRRVSETKMNKASSRSHCLFSVTVHTVDREDSGQSGGSGGAVLERVGRLHLIDLAGSECAKSAGNAGDPGGKLEQERKNINQSLLTLGRVILALKTPTKNQRIPYRDSKLTRILQEALGGKSKTCLIATVSPSILAVDETVSTLNYAKQALGIVNQKQESSIKMVHGHASSGSSGFAAPTASSLAATGMTTADWNEVECKLQYMESQVDEAQSALGRKHAAMQEAQGKVEALEGQIGASEEKAQAAEATLAKEQVKKAAFVVAANTHTAALEHSRSSLSTFQALKREALQTSVSTALGAGSEEWANSLTATTGEAADSVSQECEAAGDAAEALTSQAGDSVAEVTADRRSRDDSMVCRSTAKGVAVAASLQSVGKAANQGEQALGLWASEVDVQLNQDGQQLEELGVSQLVSVQEVGVALAGDVEAVEALLCLQRKKLAAVSAQLQTHAEGEDAHAASLTALDAAQMAEAAKHKAKVDQVADQVSATSTAQENGRRNTELSSGLVSMKSLVDSTALEQQEQAITSCSSRMEELAAVADGFTQASQAQEAGRRNQELDQGLSGMQGLVDSTAMGQQATAQAQSQARTSELSAISSGISEASISQKNGRQNKELDSNLVSMKIFVDSTAQEQQASANEACAARSNELAAVSTGIGQCAATQEAGRRNKELGSGLASMKSLVDSTANEQQATAITSCSSRMEELAAVADGFTQASQAQEAGRRNQELDQGLSGMQGLVNESTKEQTELLTAQQDDLRVALFELENGNAVAAHTDALAAHATDVENAAQATQGALDEQHEGLSVVLAKMEADHGEESAVAQCEEQRAALNEGFASALKQLGNHQAEMGVTASKLEGAVTGDQANLTATLESTSAFVESAGRQAHTEALAEQAAQLDAHAARIDHTLQEQTEAHETMHARVMAGVAALLTEGMAGLNAKLTNAVQELSAENRELKEKNGALSARVASFADGLQAKVSVDAQGEVDQWGAVCRGIRSDVLATTAASQALSAQLEALGEDQNERADNLVSNVSGWGASNRAVAERVQVEAQAALSLHKQVGQLDTIAQAAVKELTCETSVWGVSNGKVAEAIGAITMGSEVICDKTATFKASFTPMQEDALMQVASWKGSDDAVVQDMHHLVNDTNTCQSNVNVDKETFVASSTAFVESFVPQQEDALSQVAAWKNSDDAVVQDMHRLVNDTNTCQSNVNEDKEDFVASSTAFVESFVPQQEDGLSQVAAWKNSDDEVVADMHRLVNDTDACNACVEEDKELLTVSLQEFVNTFTPMQEDALMQVASWKDSDDAVVQDMHRLVNDTNTCQSNVNADKDTFVASSTAFVESFVPQQEDALSQVAAWKSSDDAVVASLRSAVAESGVLAAAVVASSESSHAHCLQAFQDVATLSMQTKASLAEMAALSEDSVGVSGAVADAGEAAKAGLADKVGRGANVWKQACAAVVATQRASVKQGCVKPRPEVMVAVAKGVSEAAKAAQELVVLVEQESAASNERMSTSFTSLSEDWQKRASDTIAARTSAASSSVLALAAASKKRCAEHVAELASAGKEHTEELESAEEDAASAGEVQLRALKDLSLEINKLQVPAGEEDEGATSNAENTHPVHISTSRPLSQIQPVSSGTAQLPSAPSSKLMAPGFTERGVMPPPPPEGTENSDPLLTSKRRQSAIPTALGPRLANAAP